MRTFGKWSRMQVMQRFLEYASPEPNTGCWLWTKTVDSHGYGRMYVKGGAHGAHRVSYELFVGPIPACKLILHKCDMPICVNPDHLLIGTQSDNMNDSVKKDRSSFVLTREQVLEIRTSNKTQRRLAREFGVCKSTIGNVRTRKTWRHV